ncbi:hypothetical protein [Flavobacterium sp. SORGH_AS_0622]|uniref:hypothetical protein n=1 Tax=Flavobacterium sp. SORGH_AS_0622 TaxID=3041772 RepID=UPI00277DE14B|nr:hypothetical protein [Flavobacterium sp. SORGH_AS_0622]MDQ1165924.1 ribosome recycling factor [Flavobacterium sp. SORGH_AS_0622]
MHRFIWWLKCIEHYRLGNRDNAVRNSIQEATSTIRMAQQHKATFKRLILESNPEIQKQFSETIEEVHPLLNIKKGELTKIFNEVIE